MSFSLNMPPSMMAKIVKEAGDGEEVEEEGGGEKKRSREDYKKLKELEEMRKAGTAPAMKDEEGRDINPHIPQYIMQAPWYYGVTQATLKHQRIQPETLKEFSEMHQWYNKGVKEGTIATKFRKGACENCGAMTHKKKDCLERPRKVTAKYSGSNFAPDEYVNPDLDFDYDGKRDRWNGYDPSEHAKVIADYQKIDQAKKLLKAQKLEEESGLAEAAAAAAGTAAGGDDSDKDNDEDKYADDVDMPGQKFETKQRITVRNLRIREDTAKYLYNLNVNSAHYDPKTRSMRDNPFDGPSAAAENKTHIPFMGDNFVRYSGGAMEMAKQQLFAWEAYEKGSEVHLQADPTKLEMLNREFRKRKDDFSSTVKDSILDKYGGQEHLEAPPRQLLLAQNEQYVEYSRTGSVIKGEEKAAVKSQYEEDVYINNHTAVWGSFWAGGRWGFHCCHSTIRESYCTGEAGKNAHDTQIPAITAPPTDPATSQPPAEPSNVSLVPTDKFKMAATTTTTTADDKSDSDSADSDSDSDSEDTKKAKRKAKERKKKKKEKKKKRKKDKKRKKKKHASSSESESEDEEAARERRIKEALLAETERVRRVDALLKMDERKRPYNSMEADVTEPTEEEMEAFRRKRLRDDDPMAKFLS